MIPRILLLATTVVCSAALPAHSATTFLAMKSPGGIEFWYQARPDLPKSTVVAGWRDGLGYALPGKQSLSKIAPALMERGAGERSANELSEAMDDFGADSNLTSDGWRAYATLTAAPDKLAGAALIEHDIFAAPRLEATT